jgi:MFS family permease
MSKSRSNALSMFALIIAGEAVFLLPFILIRVFRPIIREAFLISDLEIGKAQALYGVTAMISYIFGGFFADKFEARKLLSASLLLTALGGMWMITIPSFENLRILYGFWGVSTILFFWAALIKATRQWGHEENQGFSFGLLDGGRGAFAALIATFGAFIPSLFFPENTEEVTLEDTVKIMQYIIGFITVVVLLVSLFIWNILPKENKNITTKNAPSFDTSKLFSTIVQPKVIFHALIIVCAYSAYKITDIYATYAKDVWNYSLEEASYFGVLIQWIRPIAAISIGWIADKFIPSKLIMISFAVLLVASLFIGFGVFEDLSVVISISTFVLMVTGTYSLRGLYFAIIEEAKIPIQITGTLIGFISVIGFTPDIFMSLLSGYMLGTNPTIVEYQNLFQVFIIFPIIGLLASIGFRKMIEK